MATVPLRVPSRAVPRLRNLADLSDDQSAEVLAALEKISPVVSRQSLSVRLQTPLPHLDKNQSEELVSVLFSLWAVSASHDWDLHDVAETAAQDPDVKLPESKQTSFAERLYSALKLPSIAEPANAADIATEYDALYHVARCFTDIRPVVGREPGSTISGAVVVHNLKFDYFTSGEAQSLTLTLSSDDLRELINVLKSAQDASAKINDMVRAAGLRLFEFSEHVGSRDGGQS